jgi:hypothetical protein
VRKGKEEEKCRYYKNGNVMSFEGEWREMSVEGRWRGCGLHGGLQVVVDYNNTSLVAGARFERRIITISVLKVQVQRFFSREKSWSISDKKLPVVVDDNSISLGDVSKGAGDNCARHVIPKGKRGRYQQFIACKINKNVEKVCCDNFHTQLKRLARAYCLR